MRVVIEDLRRTLLAMPGVSSWPEMVELIEQPVAEHGLHCWDYPGLACEAVGGRAEQAVAGATSIFCLLQSIHLVDDLLDEDPQGAYHELGVGRTANLALAFQAAASRVIEEAGLPAAERAALHASLAKIALDTAYGQELDVGELSTEDDYWRVVAHKTPPLFGGALFLGAVLGGAPLAMAAEVEEIGVSLGMLVQISDDVKDALARPPETDWRRPYANLPILFALTADHPRQERFRELLERIEEEKALVEAQDILVKSGAVSFGVYRIMEYYRAARQKLHAIELRSPAPLEELLSHYLEPVENLFKKVGAESPESLLQK